MKKKFLKQLALSLVTIILSLHVYVAMADDTPAIDTPSTDDKGLQGSLADNSIVKTNLSKDNLCIKDDDMNKITAVIEEPMDFGSLKNDKGDEVVRNCLRVTICTKRDEIAGGKTECISTLNTIKIKTDNTGLDTDRYRITYTPVQVFLSQSGVDMLYFYIGAIYRWGASVIGVIAVLVIIISGIQISAAGGEQAAVTSAKTRITQSLIGIVVLFMSGIILYSINPTFFTAGQ